MNPDDIINAMSAQNRWQELSDYRSKRVEERLKKVLALVAKKLDGAFIVNEKIPEGVVAPGEILVNNISHDMIYALSDSKELNEQYAELILKIASGIKYDLSDIEKHLAFIDLRLFNEMFVGNNIIKVTTGDSALNADGLIYFWNIFAEPDERGWVSSAKFCSFVGQVAHASKNGKGSDKGFLETFNILALRHSRGEENFIGLDPYKMISSVSW